MGGIDAVIVRLKGERKSARRLSLVRYTVGEHYIKQYSTYVSGLLVGLSTA